MVFSNFIDEVDLSDAAAVLKVLGEPNRLRILAALMAGDSCNLELQETLDLPANLLSHHLGILNKAGLVQSRRDIIDGRWIYYSVDQPAIGGWQAWFQEFLDPARIQERVLCGPEGRCVDKEEVSAAAA